jgi:methylenetetrahydrofolate dehydrogenase (NADP+)/methenyltetrahydrofolate cyclohydrolase
MSKPKRGKPFPAPLNPQEIEADMTAKIIDGKLFAENLRGRIAGHVQRLKTEHGITPGLAVVIVGHDPASQVYVSNKAKQTAEVGMNSFRGRPLGPCRQA